MKELSIEEKAHRYDEAIERAKSLIDFCSDSELKTLEYVFHELKESEGERIRKAILWCIRTVEIELGCKDVEGIDVAELKSWFEKQGKLMKALQISNARIGELVEKNYYLKEELEKQGEQKPADTEKGAKGNDKEIPNSAWSEKDKKMSRFIGNAITADDASEYLKSKGIQIIDAHIWLEELKERVQPQLKQEWSEEDEKFVHGLIRGLSAKRDIHGHTTFSSDGIDITKTIDWLKSLKDRYTWKPSDEQMDALRYVTNFDYGGYKAILVSLYEQLKKLREE